MPVAASFGRRAGERGCPGLAARLRPPLAALAGAAAALVVGAAIPGGGAAAADPDCPPSQVGLTVSKTSVPAPNSIVIRGDTISYTVTAQNTGNVGLVVQLDDDLSGVLPAATYNDDAIGRINGVEAGTATFAGNHVTWRGPVPGGQSATLTYSVTVSVDAAFGYMIVNRVTGSATGTFDDPSETCPPTETTSPAPTGTSTTTETATPTETGTTSPAPTGTGTTSEPGITITDEAESENQVGTEATSQAPAPTSTSASAAPSAGGSQPRAPGDLPATGAETKAGLAVGIFALAAGAALLLAGRRNGRHV